MNTLAETTDYTNEKTVLLDRLHAISDEIGLSREVIAQALARPIALGATDLAEQASLMKIEALTRVLTGAQKSVQPEKVLEATRKLLNTIWLENVIAQ